MGLCGLMTVYARRFPFFSLKICRYKYGLALFIGEGNNKVVQGLGSSFSWNNFPVPFNDDDDDVLMIKRL